MAAPPLAGPSLFCPVFLCPEGMLRDLKTPGRFVSFAEWESFEAIELFRARPDWNAMVGAMRERLVSSNICTFERMIWSRWPGPPAAHHPERGWDGHADTEPGQGRRSAQQLIAGLKGANSPVGFSATSQT